MKPNLSVSRPNAGQTKLTYAAQVDPSPLTVSLGNENPTLGSLEVTITNGTNQTLQVTSIKFTISVGNQADCLTTNTGTFAAATSDNNLWSVSLPGDISNGLADIILESSQENTPVPLAPSASVVMQIYQIPTSVVPGTSIVQVKEDIGGAYASTSFSVTTFPYGFYFNSLTATVPNGGSFVPVSQVPHNTPVTLLWDSSVVDATSILILYSSNQGQQQATPTANGEWLSPALVSDTVFTVQVTATLFNSNPAVATLTVPVSVTPADLVAASVSVAGVAQLEGSTTISGPLQITGSVQMLQGPTAIQPGSYTCDTDALIIGYVVGPPSAVNCFGWIYGTCGSMTVGASGGYVFPAGIPYNWANLPSTFVLPISQGASFTLSASNFFATVISSFWAVPLGGGSAQLTQIAGPSETPEPPPNLVTGPRLAPEVKTIIEALLLDNPAETKQRLRSLLEEK